MSARFHTIETGRDPNALPLQAGTPLTDALTLLYHEWAIKRPPFRSRDGPLYFSTQSCPVNYATSCRHKGFYSREAGRSQRVKRSACAPDAEAFLFFLPPPRSAALLRPIAPPYPPSSRVVTPYFTLPLQKKDSQRAHSAADDAIVGVSLVFARSRPGPFGPGQISNSTQSDLLPQSAGAIPHYSE